MDTVVDILRRAFGMSSGRAYKTMTTVDRDGRASAGRYPRGQTIRIVADTARMVEAVNAPLKLLVRRPEGTAEQDVAAVEARN